MSTNNPHPVDSKTDEMMAARAEYAALLRRQEDSPTPEGARGLIHQAYTVALLENELKAIKASPRTW